MTKQDILTLWRLLCQTWGSKFAEQYGAAPNEAWSAALSHITSAQAKHALGVLIKTGSGFPPTLPEFMAAADTLRVTTVKYDADGRAYLGDEPDIVRALPPPHDPETTRRNIARLRATLNGTLKDV